MVEACSRASDQAELDSGQLADGGSTHTYNEKHSIPFHEITSQGSLETNGMGMALMAESIKEDCRVLRIEASFEDIVSKV